MANSLVIVESPAKVKTIKKFLGSTYEVDASNGHVRELPKSQLGIDVENDYSKFGYVNNGEDSLQKLEQFDYAKTYFYICCSFKFSGL